MKLEELKEKKILILGFAREGKDTYSFLRKVFPKKVLGIADRNENVKYQISNDKKVNWHLGKDYLKAIKNYDVIIKSPGIPPKEILPFLTKNQKLTSQTEIFFENCPGKVIGITGTKGKSTTAFLIYKILKEVGIKTYLIGNIGKPVLAYLLKENGFFVYELSSHQLNGLKKSPQVAVLLNIHPEHLDYYRNFKEYIQAKANITRYQTKKDYLVYNARDKIVKEIAKKSKAKKISIKGVYYDLDKNAAKAVGEIFKIPKITIEKVIREFKPLPHRLEYVGTYRGIKFYNDALSTIPETTIAALDHLGDKVETIFLGGYDRGLSFKNLAKRILKSKIKNLIFFPTTGEKIWKETLKLGRKRGLPRHFFVKDMSQAVKLAYQYTKKGKICLLSCASPSFSIFKDYKEKGNLFKKYVRIYGKR